MTNVPQTRAELEAHLKEQIAFLKASAQSYDKGFLGEAKRLAVTVRVLIHDTVASPSLLRQLDLKHISFMARPTTTIQRSISTRFTD